MKIRRIKRTKTTSLIFINEESWGILSDKILHFFSIPFDDDFFLAEKETQQLKEEIHKFAWQKFLNYLSYRERSLFECRQYLNKKLCLSKILENILIKKAENLNYLNEERFTELYCEELIQKKKSYQEIYEKMLAKKIEIKLIEKILSQKYSKKIKLENLRLNLEKAIKRYGLPKHRKNKEKILNFMTRKGFSYYDVIEFLEEK